MFIDSRSDCNTSFNFDKFWELDLHTDTVFSVIQISLWKIHEIKTYVHICMVRLIYMQDMEDIACCGHHFIQSRCVLHGINVALLWRS